MTHRQTTSSLDYTRDGGVRNSTSSLFSSRSNISNPSSLEFSFILHTIKGPHFTKQRACISVNGHTFVLSPRYKKNHQRFYGNGFLIYIPADEIIRFSVGVVTPENDDKKNSKKTGFLHGFVRYSIQPPNLPIIQELTMETIGNSYTINATIGVTPSIKCKSPLSSQNPQKCSKRKNASLLHKTVPAKARRGPSELNQKRSQTQVAQARFPLKTNTKATNEKEDESESNSHSNDTSNDKKPDNQPESNKKTDQPTPFVTDGNPPE